MRPAAFPLGDRAGNDSHIAEHQTPTIAKHASITQCSKSVLKMGNGVDAQHYIEAVILKGQSVSAIKTGESGSVADPARRCLGGVRNSGMLVVELLRCSIDIRLTPAFSFLNCN